MLVDIDELILKCTDNNSKFFIDEAVKSYKAGAYRACINNTWLALIMNITFKIEQLALMNDAEAIKQKEILDKIKETNDISMMLKFERDLLKIAKERFEFFDNITLIDLERIREDRNRCSHPLLNINNEPFVPTAELARQHLYIAVDKCISESNVFGKAALDKILELINNPIFPTIYKDAEKVLQNSYLASPKKSLVVNLIKILIKDILNNNHRLNFQNENVLKFLFIHFRDITERTFNDVLNDIVDITNSFHLQQIQYLLSVDQIIWEILSDDTKIFIQRNVLNLPPENFCNIDFWLNFKPTKKNALLRINHASRNELMKNHFFITPKEVRKKIFELYLASNSYAEANSFAQAVINAIFDIERDEIIDFISKINKNNLIKESNSINYILCEIQKNSIFTKDEFNELLINNNLQQFVMN